MFFTAMRKMGALEILIIITVIHSRLPYLGEKGYPTLVENVTLP